MRPLHKHTGAKHRPLIAHVLFRFDVGGLENGVVNLINRLPAERYRHAVIALTEVTDFRARVQREDVRYIALNKRPGHGYRLFPQLYRIFRELAPTIVHTRNLASLEAALPAALARVPVRIHGEHGWDQHDFDGAHRGYRLVRRFYRPFVHRYVALSQHLADYLVRGVGVPPSRISQIYNGVDTTRFQPASPRRAPIAGCPFVGDDVWIVGTVGRLQTVKNPVLLAQAFARAAATPEGRRLRLVIAGDGTLRDDVRRALAEGGVLDRAWLAGERNDVPELLRGLDCFALPSRAEGISNAILEAMATGLPIVATHVGGNPELIEQGVTGTLVALDPQDMAQAILAYARNAATARAHGTAARERAASRFGLARMVQDYQDLYDELCEPRLADDEAMGRASLRKR